MFDLSGKVAVLTGVGSGIGKASATTLAAAGATIVGGDIDEAGAQATADEIKADGGTAVVQRTTSTAGLPRCRRAAVKFPAKLPMAAAAWALA